MFWRNCSKEIAACVNWIPNTQPVCLCRLPQKPLFIIALQNIYWLHFGQAQRGTLLGYPIRQRHAVRLLTATRGWQNTEPFLISVTVTSSLVTRTSERNLGINCMSHFSAMSAGSRRATTLSLGAIEPVRISTAGNLYREIHHLLCRNWLWVRHCLWWTSTWLYNRGNPLRAQIGQPLGRESVRSSDYITL